MILDLKQLFKWAERAPYSETPAHRHANPGFKQIFGAKRKDKGQVHKQTNGNN